MKHAGEVVLVSFLAVAAWIIAISVLVRIVARALGIRA